MSINIYELIKEGMSLNKACKKVGLSAFIYYKWFTNNAISTMAKGVKTGGNGKRADTKNGGGDVECGAINIEALIASRNTLMSDLNSVNTNLKSAFEKVRKLEESITF